MGRSITAVAGTAEMCAAASARSRVMAVAGKRSSHRRVGGPGEAAARLRALSHVVNSEGSSLGNWLREQSSGTCTRTYAYVYVVHTHLYLYLCTCCVAHAYGMNMNMNMNMNMSMSIEHEHEHEHET